MDWSEIALIAVGILLLISGGYIKKLVKETKELFDVCHQALQDGKVTSKELAGIIKEATDVGEVLKGITKVIRKK